MSDTDDPTVEDGQSDEELAAAWGAETEGEVESAQSARVLNQAEIDSLLGFDSGPAGDEAHTGMQKIISSGLVSYERLPMLEIVFDRLVRIMSTSLRNFTSDNVEVGIDNMIIEFPGVAWGGIEGRFMLLAEQYVTSCQRVSGGVWCHSDAQGVLGSPGSL
jgi:hypothetical protein